MATRRIAKFDGHPPRVVERARWVDNDREWRPKLTTFAEEIGWKPKWVLFWHRQLALAIFLEARWPQPCAEAWAFECLRQALDKRGQEPS